MADFVKNSSNQPFFLPFTHHSNTPFQNKIVFGIRHPAFALLSPSMAAVTAQDYFILKGGICIRLEVKESRVEGAVSLEEWKGKWLGQRGERLTFVSAKQKFEVRQKGQGRERSER